MRKTVRIRLTLWYVGVLALVLTIFSLGVYLILGNALRQRLDGNLRSAAQVAALALNHEIEEHNGKAAGEQNVRLVLNTMHQTSFPRPNIAIWDAGRLVAEKPGIAGVAAQVIGRAGANSTSPMSFHTAISNGGAYRVAVSDVLVPFIGVRYRVVANESLQPVESEMNTLIEAILITVPMCLLVAAAGGYLLARKSLRPVLEMAETAQQISSRNLDQRLTVVNPNDELGFLAITFNRMIERLQKAFRQQRQFMTDASHELRTPVSVALTATQVSLRNRSETTDDLRETLRVVESQLVRLRRVVEDMFTLAQADTGAYQLVTGSFYLDEVVSESVRAARVLGSGRGVEVGAGSLVSEALCEGDEGLIRQLILILLDNAVKFTPAGGRVTVTMARSQPCYMIHVEDTGPGIQCADQPFIFDRFYRADKSRSRREAAGGAGLGLAIAKWIAELHQGTVTLEKSNREGSIFSVRLPAPKVPERALEAPQREATQVSRT